jgi:hypothetical protein
VVNHPTLLLLLPAERVDELKAMQLWAQTATSLDGGMPKFFDQDPKYWSQANAALVDLFGSELRQAVDHFVAIKAAPKPPKPKGPGRELPGQPGYR